MDASHQPKQGPTVQSIARSAKLTFNVPGAPDVDYIASLGSYGHEPQNITKALIQKYCLDPNNPLPLPYKVQIPMLVKSNAECEVSVRLQDFWMYLPHDWFVLEGCSSQVLNTLFGLDSVGSFWDEHDMDNDPKLFQNPIKDVHAANNDLHKLVALSLHGDAGRFHRNDSMMVISMRSLHSDANVASSQLLLAGIPKVCINKSTDPNLDTMFQIWKILKWSFTHLFYGKHPDRNHTGRPWIEPERLMTQGKPLFNGWKACIFALTGDLEYFQNEMKLHCHAHNDCCWNCSANKSDIPHNDFRPVAKWRETCKTAAQHRANPPSNHLVMDIPGVVAETFAYDSLHIMEEGTASHSIANCFFDWVIGRTIPGTQDARCKTLFEQILSKYQELGTPAENRIGKLTLRSFIDPENKHSTFPSTSGIKARHLRYLVPVVKLLCADDILPELLDTEKYTQHRFACLEHLEKLYLCLDYKGLHLTHDLQTKFRKHTNLFLVHYTKCCKIKLSQNKIQWNTVNKFHFMAHMPSQACFFNPKYVTTYTGETMVGFMCSLGHACLNGTPSHLVSKQMTMRFRLALQLRVFYGSDDVTD